MSSRFNKEQVAGMVEKAWKGGYQTGRQAALDEADIRNSRSGKCDDTVKEIMAAASFQGLRDAASLATAKKSKATK